MESIEQENNLNQLLESSSELSQDEIRNLLKKLSSSEIAHALESSPPKQRKLFFSLLETNEEVEPETLASLIQRNQKLKAILYEDAEELNLVVKESRLPVNE